MLEAKVERLARGAMKIEFDNSGIRQLLVPIVKAFKSEGKIKDRADETSPTTWHFERRKRKP